MVARLTTGREAYAAHETRLQEIISVGDNARKLLSGGIDADAEAFEAVMSSYRLPKATPEEKTARSQAIQAALKLATESPLNIARQCALMAEFAAELADIGNPHTVTDAGTAAALAEAALQGALLQAKINLKSIKDAEYVTQAQAEIEDLINRATTARQRAAATTEAKLA
jgi:formiminotetrahydrofolate cyclodeaminase